MYPLWEKFPTYSRYSMGWRMGGGEDYARQYRKWFKSLSVAEREDYIKRNKEPADWEGFYQNLLAG